jgi:hypothetical protein
MCTIARKNAFCFANGRFLENGKLCFEIDDFAILSLARLISAICQQSVK